jgi:hypothetical protein
MLDSPQILGPDQGPVPFLAPVKERFHAASLRSLLAPRNGQAIFAKAEIPKKSVQSELQRLTQLAERGEEDRDAPGYFSMRPDPEYWHRGVIRAFA